MGRVKKIFVRHKVKRLVSRYTKTIVPLALNNKCEDGFMRGVDYYSPQDLRKSLTSSMLSFYKNHGLLPDLFSPETFTEKILYSKFFIPRKVPESGNKLLTSYFIPDEIKMELSCPEIAWHSVSPILPENNEIEPGYYYLKASHGSGMFKRVKFPLVDHERKRLETLCSEWLTEPYGLKRGSWWNNSLCQREILIEREVVPPEDSISWMFFTFSGEVAYIGALKKKEKDPEDAWFDLELNLLPYQNSRRKQLIDFSLKKETVQKMIDLSRIIGRDHSFCRIDYLVSPDGVPYLGEMTFAPASRTKYDRSFDNYLGSKWLLN